VKATNIYAEAQTITLSEIQGVTLAQSEFPNVDAGSTVSTTATYTIAEADILKGSFTNTVTAEVGNITKTAEATVKTVEVAGAIKVTKTADKTSNVKVNETVTYKITVKNTGNVTVSELGLEDILEGIQLSDLDKTIIAPGETATATATYVVKQADVDAGEINNTVTATGTDPKGTEVTGNDSEKVTAEAAAAKLSITKVADPTEDVAVGDEITYKVVVTNAGNVSVKDGVLKDDHADLSKETFALAPNETAEFTYTYKVQQADIDAGEIVNVVKANATAVRGEDPEETAAYTTANALRVYHITSLNQ